MPKIRFGGPLTPFIKWLIIVNVAVYIIQFITILSGHPMALYLGLVPFQVAHHFTIYQLVTYMFLHGGVFHILINMFMLWMFGGDIEHQLGSKRFLVYYFICGVGAGLVTVMFSSSSAIPVVGASGAIYGLLLAYGMLFPDRQVLFMFMFPIKVKYLVIIFAAVEFMSSMQVSPDGISHITHLGGIIFGFIYLTMLKRKINFGSIKSKMHYKKMKKKIKIIENDEKDNDEDIFLH